MARAARELLTRSEGGLPNLAVISSVAPFVGLFGTVWGIMSSFAAIGQAQDTSLATVAPGIAESLAATAYGLAAAIPASIGYNRIGAAYAPARTGHGLVRRRARAGAARPSGRSRARRRAAPPRGDALMALSPRKIGEGLYQPLAEINVTPLVDVMLVLLIIFMVTAPMLATGIKVNLPSAKTAQPLENKEPVIVVVAKDGAVVGRKRPGVARRAGGEGQGQAWRLQRRRSVARRSRRGLWRRRVGDGRTRGERSDPDRHRVRPAPHRSAGSGRAERADSGRAKRAGAVTVATLDGRVFEPPPVRPPWLRPLVIAIVIALHAAALSIVYLAPKPPEPPGEVIVDIQPEAPPAETPAPPAERAEAARTIRASASSGRRAGSRRAAASKPVAPPVAEQPPPPPVDATSAARARDASAAGRRDSRRRLAEQPPPPPVAEQPPPPPVGTAAARRGTAAASPNASAASGSGRACAASASASEAGRGSAAQASSAPARRSAETPAETGAEAGRRARPAETQSRSALPLRPPRGASSTSAPSSAAASASSLSAYIGEVSSAIRSRLFYPPAARARGAKGVVGVSFTIGPSGAVTSFAITRSSGDSDLDAAARSLVQGARFPPPPGGSAHIATSFNYVPR